MYDYTAGMTTKTEDRRKVQVWTVTVGNTPVRVATVEQGPRKESMCDGCLAPCCQGQFRPVLQADEFKNRKFPTLFLEPPDWLREKVPRAQAIATLGNFNSGACSFFDRERSLCRAWPDCPKGCLSYDCREDTRDEIRDFATERAKTWQGP